MVNKLLNKTLQNGANEYSQLPQRFAKEFGIDLSKTDPVVRVLMRYEGNIELLKKNKIKVESKIDNIFVVTFEISKLRNIAKIEGISKMTLGKPIKVELDKSTPKINAINARNDFGYDGEGVIIGIIDTGIDITHEDFKNPDGTTRILYIWDQIVTTSDQTPSDITPGSYEYGTEWNSTQINNGTCTHSDNIGHGTHVAGIAAGNGRGTGNNQPANTYIGVAPKADIIVVRVDSKNFANITNGLLLTQR